MPDPGLTTDECLVALQHLRSVARDLETGAADADVALTRLRATLDRELDRRATMEGQSRMTPPESMVFEPTLRRMRIVLQASRAGTMPPKALGSTLSTITDAGVARLQSFDAR